MLGLPSFKYFILLFLHRLLAQEKLSPAPHTRKAGSGSSLKKSWLRLLAQEKLAPAPHSRKAGSGSATLAATVVLSTVCSRKLPSHARITRLMTVPRAQYTHSGNHLVLRLLIKSSPTTGRYKHM